MQSTDNASFLWLHKKLPVNQNLDRVKIYSGLRWIESMSQLYMVKP